MNKHRITFDNDWTIKKFLAPQRKPRTRGAFGGKQRRKDWLKQIRRA